MLKLSTALPLFAFISCLFIASPEAFAMRPAMRSPQHLLVLKLMHTYWRSSKPAPNYEPTLDFLIADNGCIYNPKISNYSGNEQHDAECLEALCDLSPIDCSTGKTSSSITAPRIIEGFTPSNDVASEITAYRKAHPECHDSVILHKIPLSLARRYPDIISKEEICSQENLYAVKVDVTDHTEDNEGKRITGEPRYAQVIRTINDHWKLHLLDYGFPPSKGLVKELTLQVDALSKL